MANYTSHLKSLGVRLLIGFGTVLLVTGLLSKTLLSGGVAAAGGRLIILGLVILACVIVAPALAAIFAEWFSELFYPSGKVDTGPALSIPNAKRVAGQYREAYEAFKTLVPEHPQSYVLYASMIEVAVEDLKDPQLARSARDFGVANMNDPDACERLDLFFKRLSAK